MSAIPWEPTAQEAETAMLDSDDAEWEMLLKFERAIRLPELPPKHIPVKDRKDKLRDMIARQVNDFITKGGQITQIDPNGARAHCRNMKEHRQQSFRKWREDNNNKGNDYVKRRHGGECP